MGSNRMRDGEMLTASVSAVGGCNGAVDFGDAYFRVNLNDYPQLG